MDVAGSSPSKDLTVSSSPGGQIKLVEYPRRAASLAARSEMYPLPMTVTDAPPSADGSSVAQRLLLEVKVEVEVAEVRCGNLCSDEDVEIG